MKYVKKNLKKSFKPRKSTKSVVKRSPTISYAVKKYVKSSIHKEIENKQTYYNGGSPLNITSYVNTASSLGGYPLTPFANNMQIVQGLGQADRIGNTIKTRKLVLNYVLYPALYDVTSNPYPVPQMVKIWIGYFKGNPNAIPSDYSRFFQQGNTASAPSSNLDDMMKPVNSDAWIIKKSFIHKVGHASNTGTGGVATFGYNANNDYSLNIMRKVDLTKYCSKILKYNDSISYTPVSNHSLFMFIEAVEATGNTGGAGIPIKMRYWIDYTYEDA